MNIEDFIQKEGERIDREHGDFRLVEIAPNEFNLIQYQL